MRIAVLGTGMVGRALAGTLTELGHEVTVGTRDVATTMARTETDAMGNPPFSSWAEAHPRCGSHLRRSSRGERDHRQRHTGSAPSPRSAGGRGQSGRQDPARHREPASTSPPDMPPTLFVKDTDSLGEQIQRTFPGARVVKALNTMNAYLMVDPKQLANGDFASSSPATTLPRRLTVTELLRSFGHTDVIDLGDISTARGAEMILPLWLRLWGALGTPDVQLQDRPLIRSGGARHG